MTDYYQENYKVYHEKTFSIDPSSFLEPLAQRLPAKAFILDVGCGSGRDLLWMKRSVDDWGTALIGVEEKNRASALQFLTSARWGHKKARIENLERLFRATHLFSQTDPELLVEFELDSTLSPDLVSRMLALDDYASGLAKTSAITTEGLPIVI